MSNVLAQIETPNQVVITGDAVPGANDLFKLVMDQENPNLLDVFEGSDTVPRLRVPLREVGRIIVNGGAGDDQLTVDNNRGMIFVPDLILFNGGGGNDTLITLSGPNAARTEACG